MQRLFSMFPGGAPGAGLLALRLAMVAQGTQAGLTAGATFAVPWTVLPLAVLGGCLVVGLGAPLTALGVLVLNLLVLTIQHDGGLVVGVVNILTAVAYGCLGPGRWSFDAAIFGRRVVELPSASPKP